MVDCHIVGLISYILPMKELCYRTVK
jgi:hypothetical protein